MGRFDPELGPEISPNLFPGCQDFIFEVLVGKVSVTLRVDEQFRPLGGFGVAVKISGPSLVHHAQLDGEAAEVSSYAREDPELGEPEMRGQNHLIVVHKVNVETIQM